jgi:hypothetical protein
MHTLTQKNTEPEKEKYAKRKGQSTKKQRQEEGQTLEVQRNQHTSSS